MWQECFAKGIRQLIGSMHRRSSGKDIHDTDICVTLKNGVSHFERELTNVESIIIYTCI